MSRTKTSPPPPRAPEPPRAKERRGLARWAVGLVGSYAIAIVLLLALFVIVLYGTFAQSSMSLYEVQRTIFGSWWTVLELGPVPVPWPGGGTILVLLALNLVVGGVIRIRKGSSTAGILIAHLSVLLLFAGSLVESLFSDKGHMSVFLGGSADEFVSAEEWEIVVRERSPTGSATEWILPSRTLTGLDESDLVRFTNARLPFDFAVTGWRRSVETVPAPRGTAPSATADGWVLQPYAWSKDMMEIPGCWATVVPKDGGASQRTLLWGGQSFDERIHAARPWVVSVAGRRFEIDLRTRRWTLPYKIELVRFVHTEHAGTATPKEFSSYVRKIEGGVARDVHITMNEPLRHGGYTLYQSSWGPQGQEAEMGGTPWSVFQVVKNPSDRVPLVAFAGIFVGLVFHFGRRLLRYVASASRAREGTA